jgi:hypothetical protein
VNLYHFTAPIVLALLMPTDALAQSHTFYGWQGHWTLDHRQQRCDDVLRRERQGYRAIFHKRQPDDDL